MNIPTFIFFLYFEVGPVTKHVHLGDRQNEVRQCVIMNAYSKRVTLGIYSFLNISMK